MCIRDSARPAHDLRISGTTVAMVAPRSFPRPKPKLKPKPRPAARPKRPVSVAAVASRPPSVSGGGWKTARVSTYGIGDGLVGEGMANGNVLTEDGMFIAHKTLPFGTRVQFAHDGRTCIAEVTDRGPFIKGREFDLGPAPARALAFDGVGEVRWRIVH